MPLTETIIANHPNVVRIDTNLNNLVKKIELLNYINPTNIEQEKRNFFSSKYNINPRFHYKKIDFDAHRLQQELFSQDIDSIKDEETRNFYRDVIYDYSGLIQCIEAIGKGSKFYFNSLKSFGTPTEKDVENAKFILHFEDEEYDQEMFPVFNATEAADYFQEFAKQFVCFLFTTTRKYFNGICFSNPNLSSMAARLYSRSERPLYISSERK